jgi:hypothetical protein
MKMALAAMALLVLAAGFAPAAQEPKLLPKVNPLPTALDRDFEFRKTKLFFMGEKAEPGVKTKTKDTARATNAVPSKATTVVQDASISFERKYRLYGAVTALDQHQRFGDYFDFFWRAKRPADLTMRLEYRQEKLHAFVQAQEISYSGIRGNRKTEFKVVGDDFIDGGRVIAWRCLLIENGRIVAENRSFMWE